MQAMGGTQMQPMGGMFGMMNQGMGASNLQLTLTPPPEVKPAASTGIEESIEVRM